MTFREKQDHDPNPVVIQALFTDRTEVKKILEKAILSSSPPSINMSAGDKNVNGQDNTSRSLRAAVHRSNLNKYRYKVYSFQDLPLGSLIKVLELIESAASEKASIMQTNFNVFISSGLIIDSAKDATHITATMRELFQSYQLNLTRSSE